MPIIESFESAIPLAISIEQWRLVASTCRLEALVRGGSGGSGLRPDCGGCAPVSRMVLARTPYNTNALSVRSAPGVSAGASSEL